VIGDGDDGQGGRAREPYELLGSAAAIRGGGVEMEIDQSSRSGGSASDESTGVALSESTA
jgi:hypothetical protein